MIDDDDNNGWPTTPRNFAGYGYRQVAINGEREGFDGFRKEILMTPDGEVLLTTKNGNPQIVSLAAKKTVIAVILDGLMAPLIEGNWSIRGYYDEVRVWSNCGHRSHLLKPIRTITVTSSDPEPVTLNLCLSNDTILASGGSGDLVEISRATITPTVTAEFIPARDSVGGGTELMAYYTDKEVSSITFSRGGASSTFVISPLGINSGTVPGMITGTNVAWYIDSELGPLLNLYTANTETDKQVDIYFDSPGGFLEAIKTEFLPNFYNTIGTFPANKNIKAFGMIKGYNTPVGFFTDESMTSQISSTRAQYVASGARHDYRYYKFSGNPDVQVTNTNKVIPGDLMMFPNVYKDPSGAVWVISFTAEVVAGQSRKLRCSLRITKRFDKYLEGAQPNLSILIGTLDVDDETYRTHWIEQGIFVAKDAESIPDFATGIATEYRNSEDSASGYGFVYYSTTPGAPLYIHNFATAAVVSISISGTGHPDTGVGITATMTEVPVVIENVYADNSTPTSDTGWNPTGTYEQVQYGYCGLNGAGEPAPMMGSHSTGSGVQDVSGYGSISYSGKFLLDAIHHSGGWEFIYFVCTRSSNSSFSSNTTMNISTTVVPSCNSDGQGGFYVTGESIYEGSTTSTLTSDSTVTLNRKITSSFGDDLLYINHTTISSYDSSSNKPNAQFPTTSGSATDSTTQITTTNAYTETSTSTEVITLTNGVETSETSSTGNQLRQASTAESQLYGTPNAFYILQSSPTNNTDFGQIVRGRYGPGLVNKNLLCPNYRERTLHVAADSNSAGCFH